MSSSGVTTRLPDGLPRDPTASYDPLKAAKKAAPPPDAFGAPAAETFFRMASAMPAETTEVDLASLDADGPPPAPPMRSGFRLQRPIGYGGLGEIWEASQDSLDRVVAIKRLRDDIYARPPESSTAKELWVYEACFRQEAMTTGSLEHPNIVPVYDFGTDEHGRPLLAMKRVRGHPWSAMLRDDFRELPVVDHLARHLPVLVAVGNAVAYAHSRNIIHRDIKPSQVMVGEFGEVFLMDWGLAIPHAAYREESESGEIVSPVADGDAAPLPVVTASNPSGTPAYMAPEQTETTLANIGPWTDVFLLGGLLYTILTGTVPHDGSSSASAFSQAMVGDVVPPEERAPGREIPSELSDLCLRAMAREPRERIPSAKQFVREIEDYLTGATRRRESVALTDQLAEAIDRARDDYKELGACNDLLDRALLAWPENPAVDALRERVLLRYVRSAIRHKDLVLARIQAMRLDPSPEQRVLLAEIDRLEQEQREADERLRAAYRQIEVQRDRAEEARARAEDLMSFMMKDLHHGLKRLGRLDLLEKMALKALEYYAGVPEREENASLLHKRALALRSIGEVLRDRGKIEQALRTFEEARDLADRLTAADPENPEWQCELAESYRKIGEILYDQRDLAGTLRSYQFALVVRETLANRDPDNLAWQNELGWTFEGIGAVNRRMGSLGEALTCHREAVALRERLIERDPDNPQWKHDMSWSANSIAVAHAAGEEFDEARAWYLKAIRLRTELVDADPGNSTYQRGLAWSLGCLATLNRDQGDLGWARAGYEKAIKILRRLAEIDPANDRVQRELAWSCASLASVFHAEGETDLGMVEVETAIAIQERLARIDATYVSLLQELAWSLRLQADLLLASGDLDRAMSVALRARDIREALPDNAKERSPTRVLRGRSMLQIGRIHAALGDADAAQAEWGRVLDLMASEPARDGGRPDPIVVMTRAEALIHLGRGEEAREDVARLIERGWRDPSFVGLARRHGLAPPASS